MMDFKLKKLLGECDNHLKRLNSANAKMAAYMPLNTQRYVELTEDEIGHLDQFLYRFTKLQDTIGEKLFVSILENLQEPNPNAKPYIEILNRLERLGLLEDKNVWLELRKIRNMIAHQYEDEPQQAAEALNAIYAAKIKLGAIYLLLKDACQSYLSVV